MKQMICLIFLAVVACIYAEDLRWPVDIEIIKTSSFAEFRGMRFHAGIDLSTGGRTGIPVHAIADGYISRMKVEFRGYGYALYVDHPQLSLRSVYAHLEDFSGPAAQYARKKLEKMKARFGIDDYFKSDRFPVKRGQIIAYTGESGNGPPHLHFELRKPNDDPVSPTVVGYKIPDKRAPDIKSLFLDPLSPETRINGGFLPVRIDLEKKGPGEYRWTSRPEIDGNIGLLLGVLDTGKTGNKFGVECISVFLDGKKTFERIFHEFSYSEMSQCPLIYDYLRSSAPGTGYVYTLFKWPAETVQFSKNHTPWSGVIGSESPGKKEVLIEVVDFGGNRVKITGSIDVTAKIAGNRHFSGPLELKKLSYGTFSIVAECSLPGGVKAPDTPFFFASCNNPGEGKEILVPAFYDGKRVQIAFPVDRIWESGAEIGGRKILPPHKYIDKSGGRIETEAGGFVEFPPDSLNFPILGRFERINMSPKAGGTKKSGLLPSLSPMWKLSPDTMVAAQPYRICLVLPRSDQLKALGIYQSSGAGKYSYSGGAIQGDKIVFSTRYSNSLTVLDDKVPPKISFKHRRKIKHLESCWVFSVSDSGEGVDYLSAAARVQGKITETYSDPDKREIYVICPAASGKRLVDLELLDNAGNHALFSGKL